MMAMRQFNREEVCAVYDVKPSQVGALSTPGAGYSSVVEVNRDLYRTTLPPWFTLIEETIESQLIEPEPMWAPARRSFAGVLAIATLPLVLRTLWLGLRRQDDRHRRIARWTLPIWLYVSVTGVIVYLMLYRLYPPPSVR